MESDIKCAESILAIYILMRFDFFFRTLISIYSSVIEEAVGVFYNYFTQRVMVEKTRLALTAATTV
ncbi:MAG: hypothetical protein ACRCUW_03425 [Plesiomonas shigelloides]|nr:hypothetical protein [Plesiomonas shigelloides]